jgi:hypothetical protein
MRDTTKRHSRAWVDTDYCWKCGTASMRMLCSSCAKNYNNVREAKRWRTEGRTEPPTRPVKASRQPADIDAMLRDIAVRGSM